MSARFPDAQIISPATPRVGRLHRPPDGVERALQRGRTWLARGLRRGTLGLTLVAVIMGVYLAAQWQSKPRRVAAAPEYRREIAGATIQRLEAEQADLKKRIADLRGQLTTRDADGSNSVEVSRLNDAVARERLLAGTVAVHGPGLRITLDDSAVKTIPPKEDPAMYIVHEYQLRDIVNVLWAAGAEAISINGERVVSATSIYCVGSTILVNDTRTSPPYEFVVVGDQARLEAALAEAANLKALKSRIKLYGLLFNVQRPKDVAVGAYAGGLDVRHVQLDLPEAARGGRIVR